MLSVRGPWSCSKRKALQAALLAPPSTQPGTSSCQPLEIRDKREVRGLKRSCGCADRAGCDISTSCSSPLLAMSPPRDLRSKGVHGCPFHGRRCQTTAETESLCASESRPLCLACCFLSVGIVVAASFVLPEETVVLSSAQAASALLWAAVDNTATQQSGRRVSTEQRC